MSIYNMLSSYKPQSYALADKTTFSAGTTTTWTVPDGVFSICLLAIGAGGSSLGSAGNGGGGGGLAWYNDYLVTPGQVLNVKVGTSTTSSSNGDTYISLSDNTIIVKGGGGANGTEYSGGTFVGPNGGIGGRGGSGHVDEYGFGSLHQVTGAGGGAAAGYGTGQYTGAGLSVHLNGSSGLSGSFVQGGGSGGQGSGGGSGYWYVNSVATSGGSGGSGQGITIGWPGGTGNYGWGSGAGGTGGTKSSSYPANSAGGPGVAVIMYGNGRSWPSNFA